MCWKVISDVLYQFLILIWSPHQPLIRFLMFEKKVAKSWILAENGLLSLQRAREASYRKIWSYGVQNLLDQFFQMLFHIKVDIIRGLDQKFENRKKSFWIFPFLTIFLTVAFKGLYRRHKMTTIWAFLSDRKPLYNDTLRFDLQRSSGQIDLT